MKRWVSFYMTEGHLELSALYKLKGRDAVMRYMLKETLYIYASQGIKLNSRSKPSQIFCKTIQAAT